MLYEIIETDEGYTIVSREPPRDPPEEIALRHRGVLVDPGPYQSYEVAYDAVLALDDEDDEE